MFDVRTETIWKSYDGHSVVFPDTIMRKLISFRQTNFDMLESGGLLLGRHIIKSPVYIVDYITKPMNGDNASRYSFYRGKKHQQISEKYWKETKRTGQLIGLWHTHPDTDPRPSAIDYNDWEKQLSKGKFIGDRLYFCIVGIENCNMWVGLKETMIFQKLELL